jgi:hypothetical protein
MTDDLEKLFADLRARTLSGLVAPGAPRARATARRRRNAVVLAGTGAAVAAVLVGTGVALHSGSGGDYVAGDAVSSSRPPLTPEPSPPADRAEAAGHLLADREKTPTSINATAGVVTSSYEDDMNDMPADTYTFRFFCVGAGTVDVRVLQGDSGTTVLGHGTATCAAHDPTPLRLTIRQPAYGYLRVFASGDARSNNRAGFAFEFLSATGKSAAGPSGQPYSYPPPSGSLPSSSLPVATSPSG